MEARYRQGIVEIGVDMFDVPVAAGQIPGAVNEKQHISVATSVRSEIQVFNHMYCPMLRGELTFRNLKYFEHCNF